MRSRTELYIRLRKDSLSLLWNFAQRDIYFGVYDIQDIDEVIIFDAKSAAQLGIRK